MGSDGDIRAGVNTRASSVEDLQLPTVNLDTGTNQPADPPSQQEEMLQHSKEEAIEGKDAAPEGDIGMQARKPWKQKKRIAQNRGAMDEIEIFEGKGVVSGPSLLEITSPEDGYLKLICKDDCEFLVPFKVVESFQCVDVILHSDAVFKEKLENVIRFPDIQPEIMEYVLRFVFIEHLNKVKAAQYWGANSPRLVFQFEVDPRQVMDLIYVAHFLGIRDLLNVTATMVARHLQDVPDVSSMPVDLAWCVAEQFSSQELYDAEERQDFCSLSLETDILWEKHCKKFLREDIIRPIAPSESPPSYDTWGLYEGPSPNHGRCYMLPLICSSLLIAKMAVCILCPWVCVVMESTSKNVLVLELGLSIVLPKLAMHCVLVELKLNLKPMDISTSCNDEHFVCCEGGNESFFAEVQLKGKSAYSHTIRPMFYEWVLRAPGSLPFSSYIAQFPNLVSLYLAKLPLGNPLPDGTMPCLVIGEILQSHPLLQILDVSETGFTTEATILLSQRLHSHPRLQVLRLAYNKIGTEGFTTIVQALPYVRTLKLLDVRENGISSYMLEDAVASLQASALEDLLLEGNLKACKGFNSNPDGLMHSSISQLEDTEGTSLQGPHTHQAQSTPFRLGYPILSGIPPSLKKLQLSQCELWDTDISTLVEALGQHNIIQKLDLSDNIITGVGAISIFTWLKGNDSLLELQLSSNRITDACLDMLLQTLQSHPKLQKLSMRGNYSYGEESLFEVINAGAARGKALLCTCGLRFMLDFSRTDISFSTRARIQRRSAEWSSQLHLLI